MFPPGLEPLAFRLLGERDNRYTSETTYKNFHFVCQLPVEALLYCLRNATGKALDIMLYVIGLAII